MQVQVMLILEHAPSPKATAIQYLATPIASVEEFPIVFPRACPELIFLTLKENEKKKNPGKCKWLGGSGESLL